MLYFLKKKTAIKFETKKKRYDLNETIDKTIILKIHIEYVLFIDQI